MATGARPFEATSKSDVIAHIQDEPHVPLRSLAPGHPEAFERIVDTLLSKRPAARYATAWALRADLDALVQRAVRPAPGENAASTAPALSVAVLPFEIVGERTVRDEHFREGVAEDIRSRLGGIPGVRVAPRTSSLARAGESIRELGHRLNVETVLEGTVQQADGHIRVLAALVAAADERAVTAIRVDQPLGDLLAMQDEVAGAVARRLSPVLAVAPPKVQDSEAFHAYQRGQHYWKRCFSGGWRPAIEQFQQAVERDPHSSPRTSRWPTRTTSSGSIA